MNLIIQMEDFEDKCFKWLARLVLFYTLMYTLTACLFIGHDIYCIYNRNLFANGMDRFWDKNVYSTDMLHNYFTLGPLMSAIPWPFTLPAYILEVSRKNLCSP